MKISIFSDIHAGFGSGTERESDCFEAMEEAVEKSLDCDLILIAGDIFDTKKPSAETFSRVIEVLLRPVLSESSAKVGEGIGRDVKGLPKLSALGTPVIALHGNHERRAKGLVNPVQSLERAGFLMHLNCNGVMLQKDGEKVAVQGMSAVPEGFAGEVLEQWKPRPVKGCFNILMIHQILSGFTPSKTALDVNKLPKGFDLYVSGDVHKPEKSEYDGKPLIVAGSLIPTQLEKNEAKSKGIWKVDTGTNTPEFVKLEDQRKFYFLEFERTGKGAVEEEVKKILQNKQDKKPLIRIKIKGDFDFDSEIRTKFESRAIISFRKDKAVKRPEVKGLEEHRLSVQELGRKLLLENLEGSKLDPMVFGPVFEFLSEKKEEEALSFLEDAIRNDGKGVQKKTKVKQPAEQPPEEKEEIKVPESSFEQTFQKIENNKEPPVEQPGKPAERLTLKPALKKGKKKTLEKFFS